MKLRTIVEWEDEPPIEDPEPLEQHMRTVTPDDIYYYNDCAQFGGGDDDELLRPFLSCVDELD